MSFKRVRALWQKRIVRALVGILVLAAAVLGAYKLAHVPRPVDLAVAGKFAPGTIKVGEQELIIEGPVVDRDEGLLFSYDTGKKGIVQLGFDRARLDDSTLQMLDGIGVKLPETYGPIDYRGAQIRSSTADQEPCGTRIELKIASPEPAEISLLQLSKPGLDGHRELVITARGAELVVRMQTDSDDNSSAPGCKKRLKVHDVTHSTALPVTVHVAENSNIHLHFFPLKADSAPWDDAEGSLTLDLGGPPKLRPTDPPPFQARAVSIRAPGNGSSANARPVLSARSEAQGPLLTISGLRVFSDQIQVNVAGKGWLEVDGVPQTTNFMEFIEENTLVSMLLVAAYTALLGWVARLVFKTPRARSRAKNRRSSPRASSERR